jgi:hypothetical protein
LTVAEIRRTCPNIRTITIEGVTSPVDTSSILLEVAGGKTGFLELPDDVLLIIFRQLRSVELYGLSRLSRRLHLLALPLYFAQKGVPDPRELCEFRLVSYPTAADVLSALNSALFLREVKHISCQFEPGGHIACYLHHIERLTAFLGKFSSVETVSLGLIDLGKVEEVNELVRTRWQLAFGQLLHVILEKSCKELTIRGPPYLNPGAPWPKGEDTVGLSSTARTNSSALRAFFFYPPRLSHSGVLWTFSALRSSQITVLSIAVTSSALVDVIAQELPSLSELEVTSYLNNLDLKLLELLCKLTRLTRLTLPLKGSFHGNAPFIKRTVPDLACLRALTAPVHFIVHFLMADTPFPALERLEIRASTVFSLLPKWSVARVILALKDRGPLASPEIALDLAMAHTHTKQFNVWCISGGLQALLGDEESWNEVANVIDRLTVHGNKAGYPGRLERLSDANVQVLAALVPHFPALCDLSLDDGTGRQMSGWEAALAVVRGMCPEIKSLTLNKIQVYTVG